MLAHQITIHYPNGLVIGCTNQLIAIFKSMTVLDLYSTDDRVNSMIETLLIHTILGPK